ncbi:MAG TPA: hypothetical protein VHL11_12520 [Phototrophicaceae bacterium]|jgi:hypothetical protein|nr:hypothetical protein [Phototrophicaceae bacterium]
MSPISILYHSTDTRKATIKMVIVFFVLSVIVFVFGCATTFSAASSLSPLSLVVQQPFIKPPTLIPATAPVPLIDSKNVVPVHIYYQHCNNFSPDGSLLSIGNDGVYDTSNLQKRFAINGSPSSFNSTGTLLEVDNDGIYEVETGEKRFSIKGDGLFSPDETLIAVTEDGMYEMATGKKRFAISSSFVVFSPDGTLLASVREGVYEVATGKKRFSIAGYGLFNSDGTLLRVLGDGVYNVSTGEKLFTPSEFFGSFSPDGTLLAVANDGVYDVVTWQKRFAISAYGSFSPDSTLLVISNDGVYDVTTGEKRFAISGSYISFSPDGTLLAIEQDGIYDVVTGQKRFEIDGYPRFSPDRTLLTVSFGNGCLLYGDVARAGSHELPVTGAVYVTTGEDTEVYRSSSVGEVTGTVSSQGTYLVFARNSDSTWFKIGNEQWISASVVNVLSIPDDLPVEDQ